MEERRAFGSEVIAEIRSRLDIVSVVGEYVQLRKQGRNYVGLCPFHQEKTPSFTVSPERQLFYCFGCGAGGDVYNFLMRLERLTFAEALQRLAEKAGVSLGREFAGPTASRFQDLYRANQAAQAVYHHLLVRDPRGEPARAYLRRRGLGPAEWERFGLGWAPEPGVLAPYLRSKGFSEEPLVAAGLLVRQRDGTLTERFRRRVMFPIYDPQGRVVGFGGRALGEEERPKYLNTAESPIFRKGEVLYGLNWAQTEARRRGRIVVVEGYMDVLSAHRHGLTNVVASMGTALTAEQARRLRNCADQVVISFDADSAGAAATLRGLEVLRDQGCRVLVASLPSGYDPDKFVQERGPEALRKLWEEEAQPLLVYKLNRLKAARPSHDPDEKIAAARQLLPDLARAESPLARQEYGRLIAEELGIDEQALWAELKRLLKQDKKGTGRNNKTDVLRPVRSGRQRAEEELLALMLQDRSLCAQVVSVLGWDFFEDERARRVAEALRIWLAEHPEGSPDVVALVEPLGEDTSAWAYGLMLRDRAAFASVEDNLRAVQEYRLREEARELQRRLKEAGTEESAGLLVRLAEIQRALQELSPSGGARPRKGGTR
ncbi:MAG: DNA primase [Moorellales bacterium]